MRPHRPFGAVLGACALALSVSVAAAPFVPANDALVLEVLPTRQQDEALRAVTAGRRELAELPVTAPNRAQLAADVAYRYYRLAQRRGDPRYVGYAQAVLAEWPFPQAAPDAIRIARALTAQFVHDFAAADTDLSAVLAQDPHHLEARSYRAILNLVQARFDAARADCQAMLERVGEGADLVVDACLPTIMSVTGEAREAYRRFTVALSRHGSASASARLWVLTRLGETARRLGDDALAARHFGDALALDITDQYLLASQAELLLDQHDPEAVIRRLSPHSANDVLLLRLALAAQASGHADARRHEQTLRDRLDAARRRGDELHLADAARFALAFDGDAAAAVALAQRNWALGQREPADADILMRAALAARQPAAAAAALEWMTLSRHEHPQLRALADQLRSLPR